MLAGPVGRALARSRGRATAARSLTYCQWAARAYLGGSRSLSRLPRVCVDVTTFLRQRSDPLLRLSNQLGSAFRSALETGDDSLWREAACEFVRGCKQMRLPPERMLTAAKEALLVPMQSTGAPTSVDARALYDEMISCCVEEYYRDSGEC